ncbi:acyl-CoA dehydratase activase [Pelosinus baikalensis]|uniref:Acyl-CoA dehydratase activase n=1 Tax=Pelosinus baikalensis TaxID=2892015 RepID=A0ABS8HW74_9FIRM|nr:acyl-CoA dehydratase activase [Pelosinus baikalensis]
MFLGIDIGSVSTDAVLIDDDCNIKGYSIVKSGFDYKEAANRAIEEGCRIAGITEKDITKIVGTGYGRKSVPSSCRSVTEISCHAMGIHQIFPEVRTIIDIGGQDSKVIRVFEDGFVETFVMNDKCAAGTGRFLEVMAQAMGIEVYRLGELSLTAKKVQAISSICTVFAESEVISRIAQGCPKEEIIAGIHKAIGERLMSMVNSVGLKGPVALTGGVAKNQGLIQAISRHLEDNFYIPQEPQIVGALGAAIYAKNHTDK